MPNNHGYKKKKIIKVKKLQTWIDFEIYVLSVSDLEKRKMPTTATPHLHLFCWIVFSHIYVKQFYCSFKGKETPKLNWLWNLCTVGLGFRKEKNADYCYYTSALVLLGHFSHIYVKQFYCSFWSKRFFHHTVVLATRNSNDISL